jgi:Fe(3+) dicitrate transport protein
LTKRLVAVLRTALPCATIALGAAHARAQEPSPPAATSELTPPELVSFVEAKYPEAALAARQEGTVTLRLTIDAEGRVTEAEVVKPAGQGFDEVARDASLGFRFKPASRGPKAVASRILYDYEFRLPAQPRANEVEPAAGEPGQKTAEVQPPPLPPAPVEVTVLGTEPAQTPGSVHVINRRTLERYAYDDPHAITRTVPGVYARQEDGVGLRPNIGIRGAASDRSKKITLMEDGVLFAPAPYSAPAAYYFPLLPRMTQVRIVKGPAAIAYGPQTVGGAIDFITRPIPSESHVALDLAGGEYAYGKFHGWAGTSSEDGRMGFSIEGVHLRGDGFKHLPSGDDTGFFRNEWMLKASYLVDPRARFENELSLKLTYSNELSNETYLGLADADFRADPLRRYGASKLDEMRWHRTGIAVTHRTRPGRALRLETTAYRHDLSRIWRKVNGFEGASLFDVLTNPETPTNRIFYDILTGRNDSTQPDEILLIGPNQRDFVSQGIQSRVEWDARTGPFEHRVEYGLRIHHDRVERKHSEDGFQLVNGEPVPAGGPTIVTASNEAWTEAVAFHASDAVTWRALTLTPGLRVEIMRSALINRLAQAEQRGAAQVVLPGIGAFYSLIDSFGVLAGVYRGFSPPPPGNPEQTGPELSVNYEAGVRYSDKPARAELIGYYNDYSNLTDICTQSNRCLDQNLDRQFSAGAARIYGAEAYVAHEIPIAGRLKLPVSAAYTLTLTEFLNTSDSEDPIFGSVEAGDELPYVPRHQGHASVGVESERAGAYLAMTYVSAMREQAGSEPLDEAQTTDEQITFDSGASYRITRWLELYSNVRNLFDAHYLVSRRPYGARPNAPRWIQFGAKAEF